MQRKIMYLPLYLALMLLGYHALPVSAGAAVDAISSATPSFGSVTIIDKTLTENHFGWKGGNCFTCHDDPHKAGYTPRVCVTCHGTNGAPARPDSHATYTACNDCHSANHTGDNFAPPQDCTPCHRYASSQTVKTAGAYDAVVIGGGGGGLAAAARLARAGKKVILLEQHYKVGGYMSSFKRGPYTFETSLHAFDGLDPAKGMNVPLFEKLGILDKLTLVRGPIMYKSTYPDFTIEVPSDVGDYKKLLIEMFPSEEFGINRMFSDLERINSAFSALFKLQAGDFLGAIGLYKPGMFFSVISNLNTSLTPYLEKFTKNQKLLAIITQLAGFGGASPDDIPTLFFAMMWNSYHKGGYYYVEGGSQAIANAMEASILESGGEIRLSTKAAKIEIKDGRAAAVVTAEGERFTCSFVISNASAPQTFDKLVGAENLPADYVAAYKKMTYGLSMLQIYLGVDHDYRSLLPADCHEFIPNLTYDQAASFKAMREGDVDNCPMALLDYTVVDPADAPAGKNVIVISTILPYNWENAWRTDDYATYKKFKEDTAWRFINRAEAILPGLGSHIEVLEVGTPYTMEGFTSNEGGSIFGWDNIKSQALFNRMKQATPIANLFLAGAWTFPGGGQSAVMTSGSTAADMVIKAAR